VLLDALPRTPNGKVDLAALPEPERLAVSGERVPPRDEPPPRCGTGSPRLGAVWALQAPPDLPGTLEELAAGHVAALRAAQPEGPYHLAGWSFGGAVAFEMAHQLHRSGAAVAPLVLLWTALAAGGLEIRELPGDHAGVIRGEGAQRLAAALAGRSRG